MTATAEIECKKFCVRRCLFAVSFGIGIQYLLLTAFILLVNFSILHPIQWIGETFRLIFSLYTWFTIMPLISVMVLYGIFLGNSYLSVPKYYPSRIAWIYGTFARKLLAFFLHGLLGFLTAWLYSRFLSDDYRILLNECFEGYCVNGRYMFLTLGGVFAGLYYFFKENFFTEPTITFPVIQECKYVKIRSQMYSIIYKSLVQSFLPTVCYVLLYWLVGWMITSRVSNMLNADTDETFSSLYSIVMSLRLLAYTWILASQILSNMYLLGVCFTVVLTTEQRFLVEKGSALCVQEGVTLVEALALSRVPIAQHLACFDLYTLCTSKSSDRRKQFFCLSIPGGHPYNWNQLSGQCLSMINSFTDELAQSMVGLSAKPSFLQNDMSRNRLPATEAAEKVLIRQYNESFGIRNMMSPSSYQSPPPASVSSKMDPCKKVNETVDHIGQVLTDTCRAAFHSIPGLFYLFGEQEGGKTAFILSKSQDMIWLTQALAGLCSSSISEDRYGVVQKELPAIIRSYLRLKSELDRICNMNLNGRKLDRNCVALRSAVKRSLYKICTVFGEYVADLIDDEDELRRVRCFVNYLET